MGGSSGSTDNERGHRISNILYGLCNRTCNSLSTLTNCTNDPPTGTYHTTHHSSFTNCSPVSDTSINNELATNFIASIASSTDSRSSGKALSCHFIQLFITERLGQVGLIDSGMS